MKITTTQPVKKVGNDRDYAVCLLLGCIDVMSRDLAVKNNVNPEYIVTKCLLEQAINLQYRGTDQVYALLESDYGWLGTYRKIIIQPWLG